MKKIERLIGMSEQQAVDVLELQKRELLFNALTIHQLRLLWEEFSSDSCATWLIVNDETVRQFRNWIQE